ncbi:MAG: hypothetical protein MZV65_19150 [Chromatiales bacterium]|nr:hypothetical protein [Chromatiales bacterium]
MFADRQRRADPDHHGRAGAVRHEPRGLAAGTARARQRAHPHAARWRPLLVTAGDPGAGAVAAAGDAGAAPRAS